MVSPNVLIGLAGVGVAALVAVKAFGVPGVAPRIEMPSIGVELPTIDLSGLGEGLTNIGAGIAYFAEGVRTGMSEFGTGAAEQFSEMGGAVFDRIGEMGENMITRVSEGGEALITRIEESGESLIERVEDTAEAAYERIETDVVEPIKAGGAAVITTVQELPQTIADVAVETFVVRPAAFVGEVASAPLRAVGFLPEPEQVEEMGPVAFVPFAGLSDKIRTWLGGFMEGIGGLDLSQAGFRFGVF